MSSTFSCRCRSCIVVSVLCAAVALLSGCGNGETKEEPDPEVTKNLELLKGENDTWRRIAAEKLGDLGDTAAVEPLIEALENDKKTGVRAKAATALAQLGDNRAVEPLLKSLAYKDKDFVFKSAVIDALGEFRDKRAVNPLIAILNDKHAVCWDNAADALGKLGDSQAVQPLINRLKQVNVFMDYQGNCAEALAKLGDKAAVEPLATQLRHGDLKVRSRVALALASFDDKRSIPGLTGALADWNLGPRAAEALDKLQWKARTDVDRIHYLVAGRNKKDLLTDWKTTKKVLLADAARVGRYDGDVVTNAMQALIRLGQKDMIPDVVALMNKSQKEMVAKACLNCGNKELEKAATKLLQSRGYKVIELKGQLSGDWGSMPLR